MDHFASLASVLSKGGLSYDRLLNFCRIVEAGGISKAATDDPGKQSLYSRQIRELEAFFGVTLKQRRGKGLVITETGRRLAQLARAHLLGLEDFKREAVNVPKRLTIASGNSILEWKLLPRLAELRAALPNTTLEFLSLRTQDVVAGLAEMTLDLGLIRENARVAPLKSVSLFEVTYALFLPRPFTRGVTEENLKERIDSIPLACSLGGHFRQALEVEAAKAKWPLRIEVACSSFSEAARAAASGACGAVLPAFALMQSPGVVRFPLPFLKSHRRKIALVWNPRLAEVRPLISTARHAMDAMLAPVRH